TVGNIKDRPHVLRLHRCIIILSIEPSVPDGYFLPVVSFLPKLPLRNSSGSDFRFPYDSSGLSEIYRSWRLNLRRSHRRIATRSRRALRRSRNRWNFGCNTALTRKFRVRISVVSLEIGIVGNLPSDSDCLSDHILSQCYILRVPAANAGKGKI